MLMPLFTLSLALLACKDGTKASPVSVDDSCRTFDFGDETASEDQRAGLERANCYRGALGLDAMELGPALDIAAQNHAEYMDSNAEITHEEDRDAEGYTGQWPWDRAENAGYDWVSGAISEVVSYGYGPDGAVDGWMNTVYHRIPFTSPEVIVTGFGQEKRYSSMTFVTPYPYSEDVAVLYPVDGQVDVPTRFNSDEEVPDPAPDATDVGPPITVTVGSTTAPGTDQNPFVLVLREASLSGPDGDVELIELVPDDDPYLLQAIALVPVEPLAADSDYEVEVKITWSGGQETINSTFHTVAD